MKGDRISGLVHPKEYTIYKWAIGYNPFTSHLLTSWDIQVDGFIGITGGRSPSNKMRPKKPWLHREGLHSSDQIEIF